MKKGALFIILGTLVIIILMGASVFLYGLLATASLSLFHDSSPKMGLLIWFAPCIIICFIGIETVFLYSGAAGEKTDSSRGFREQDKKPDGKRQKLWILVCALILVVTMLVCVNAYVVCDTEGVTYQYVFVRTHYSWDDVISYTVTASGDTLHLTIKYRGGKSLDLAGYSTIQNRTFAQQYPDEYAFYAQIDGILESLGKIKTCTVPDSTVEALRGSEYWVYIAEILDISD